MNRRDLRATSARRDCLGTRACSLRRFARPPRPRAAEKGQAGERRLADLPLPARRPEHDRHLGPQARRPGRVPRRVQADRHQRPRHPESASTCRGWRSRWTSSRWSARSAITTPTTARPIITCSPATFPQAGFNPSLSPNNQRPAHGSIIARKLGRAARCRRMSACRKMHSERRLGLPRCQRPLRSSIDADPNCARISRCPTSCRRRRSSRPARRIGKQLLAKVDRFQQAAEAQANRDAQTVSVFQQKAFDLMTSPEAKQAFDIHAEPDKLRDEYGRNSLGQSCLMARRLVEAGVRCVTIDHSNWDTHDDNFDIAQEAPAARARRRPVDAVPRPGRARPARKTLVVVTGEFGRTPRINKDAGRDHWGPAFTVALAAAASREAASSASPTPGPSGRPQPYGPKTWPPRSITAWGSTPTKNSTRPKAGR